MSFPMQKYNKKTAKANVSASFTSFYSIWQEQEVRDIHFFSYICIQNQITLNYQDEKDNTDGHTSTCGRTGETHYEDTDLVE